jgi:hypothetical protein
MTTEALSTGSIHAWQSLGGSDAGDLALIKPVNLHKTLVAGYSTSAFTCNTSAWYMHVPTAPLL